jgi:IclR family KDG regulon transcriptional repressor
MTLLFRIAEHRRSVSLQELAREVGCSKSTVHRLLATLERFGVVERDPELRHYRLGRRARELSREPWAQTDLRQVALPHMRELCTDSSETVTLHRLEGTEHVVIEQCESPQEIRRSLQLGQRAPLLRGATAKAILASLPADEARAVLAQTRTDEDTGPSAQELEDIRSLGYAFSIAERVAGGASISVPLFDRAERVCGALSISGPSFRFTAARATRCAPALVQAATQISTALRART